MFEAIAQRITSTAIALGSMVFASVAGTNATFDAPDITVSGSKIVISTQLTECFTEELDKIFQSGQPIRIYFRVSLHEQQSDNPVLVKDFYHQVRYSLVDKYYEVYLSEKDASTTAISIGEVHRNLASVNQYGVIEADYLEPGTHYYIRITAYMQKIQLPGMEDEIDLMNYWNGKEPELRTEPFEKSMLAL